MLRRADITVDQADRVRGLQTLAHRGRDRDGIVRRKCPATSSTCRNVRPATSSITMNGVVRPPTVKDRHQARVAEGGLHARASRSNLARKAASAAYCGLRDLDRDLTPEDLVRPRHNVDIPPTPSTSRSAYRRRIGVCPSWPLS